VVEAFQWNGTYETLDDTPRWFWDARLRGAVFHFSGKMGNREAVLAIKTLEGEHKALPGDWIIRGVKDELYPCKPDIFELT